VTAAGARGRSAEIAAAWDANAENWARAVRSGAIASRAEATDAAILAAVGARRPRALLDMGCGEGWLVRRLTQEGVAEVAGLDASAALIDLARAADPTGDYRIADYRGAAAAFAGRAFDVVCFNFALLDADAAQALADGRRLLADGGAIVIQTVAPDPVCDGEEGWRTEDFRSFPGERWRAMPWYARSLAGWRTAAAQAGLRVASAAHVGEPQPVSLLLTLTP